MLNVHQLLRKALGDAMHRGLLTRNVATFVDPPRVVACSEQECWDEAELCTFLHWAGPHRLFPALRLAATTGMRRGEVGALRWTDIDSDARLLSARRSATCAGYRVHVTTNKTKTSRRAIDLDDETIAVLQEWRRSQAEELGYQPEYVFTTASGAMVHPHSVLWPNGPESHRVLTSSLEAARAAGDTVGEIDVFGERRPVPRFAIFPPTANVTGNIDAFAMYAGTSAGSIASIEPAADLVRRLAHDAEQLLSSALVGRR